MLSYLLELSREGQGAGIITPAFSHAELSSLPVHTLLLLLPESPFSGCFFVRRAGSTESYLGACMRGKPLLVLLFSLSLCNPNPMLVCSACFTQLPQPNIFSSYTLKPGQPYGSISNLGLAHTPHAHISHFIPSSFGYDRGSHTEFISFLL